MANSRLSKPIQPSTDNDFDAKQVFVRLTSYLLRYKRPLYIALFFMIAVALVETSFAAMLQNIINEVFVNAKEWYLKCLSLIFLGLMILRAVLGYLANYSMKKLGRLVTFDIRQDIFGNLITLPTQFFDENSSSNNVSKLIYDVEQPVQQPLIL